MQTSVILLTGANNGIGYHMAHALLQKGYRVAGLDIQTDHLEKLKKDYSGRILVLLCDVTDENQVCQAVQAVVEEWGHLDILVNNACQVVYLPFEERTIESLRREMEVNYFGYLRMIKAVLPFMNNQGHGLIHNVSSGIGVSGHARLLGYTASKGAIEAATRTLAFELEPHGITVNLMHPPLTDTASTQAIGFPAQVMANAEAIGKKFADKIESRRPIITPDLQTALYVFTAYRFPLALGRMFSHMSSRIQNK